MVATLKKKNRNVSHCVLSESTRSYSYTRTLVRVQWCREVHRGVGVVTCGLSKSLLRTEHREADEHLGDSEFQNEIP